LFSNGLFIVQAAIAFGILVFVHELGHFLAAKWIKVKVEVFSLGFGPILKKFQWGETEYRLSAIPLGGFVKMAGEEPDPERTPEPGDFNAKSVGQRSLVFVAGVTMNLIFGFLFFIAAYQVGVEVTPAEIGGVAPGSVAWKAGLHSGDRITAIEGISPPIDFEDLKTAIMLAGANDTIHATVSRGGETFNAALKPNFNRDLGMQVIGIMSPVRPVIADASRDERDEFWRAYHIGLQPGDRVFAVEVGSRDKAFQIETLEDYIEAIDWSGGRPVTIFVQRNGEVERIRGTPRAFGKTRWIGVHYGSRIVADLRGWAAASGLAAGDEIVAVAGTPVRSTTDIREALAQAAGTRAAIQVLRDGNPVALGVNVAAEAPGADVVFEMQTVVDRCYPNCPAAEAGLQPGDRILAIDGKELESAFDVEDTISKAKGPVTLSWVRDGKDMSEKVVPQAPWELTVPFEVPKELVRAGLVRSVLLGGRKAFQWTARVYGSIKQLIVGKVSVKLLSGPVSIAQLAYVAAKRGPGTLFYILGVLSINLAVMNLLPIPVLDGGHLLFAGIEKVRGKPVHEKIRAAATYVGLSMLLALIAVAFWNDIANLILG
jgi:regulator of sigma E protease